MQHSTPLEPQCDATEGCITCSDAGDPVTVRRIGSAPGLALCEERSGEMGEVETTLVGEVAPGDVLLVHAGVALTRLDDAATVGAR